MRRHGLTSTLLALLFTTTTIAVVVGCVAQPYGSEGNNKGKNAQTTGSTNPTPPPDEETAAPLKPAPTTTSPPGAQAPPVDLGDGKNPDGGGATSPDGGPTGACPKDTPAAGYIWKAPAAHTAACTAADIGFFEGQISSPDVTFPGLEAGMRKRNVACASCIFSRLDDVTWEPIVFIGTGAFQNWGACYVRAQGGSEACGREVQNWFSCLTDACQLCGNDAAINACQDKVAYDKTSCGRFEPAQACGASLEALNTACNTAGENVGVLCGP